MKIVDTVSSISTQQQPNPFKTSNNTNTTATGQGSRPRKSFEDHLKTHVQKIHDSAENVQPDNQTNGLLMGYYMPLYSPLKPEIRLVINSYKSNEDV